MAPFTSTPGACVGTQNMHVEIEGAADSECQRACWQTVRDNPDVVAGRCVAFSVSTKAHERTMCAMYDALGFHGPGGDAHPHRTCSLVDAAALLPDVAFDPRPLGARETYVQQLDERMEPPGISPAPPRVSHARWLSMGDHT